MLRPLSRREERLELLSGLFRETKESRGPSQSDTDILVDLDETAVPAHEVEIAQRSLTPK